MSSRRQKNCISQLVDNSVDIYCPPKTFLKSNPNYAANANIEKVIDFFLNYMTKLLKQTSASLRILTYFTQTKFQITHVHIKPDFNVT